MLVQKKVKLKLTNFMSNGSYTKINLIKKSSKNNKHNNDTKKQKINELQNILIKLLIIIMSYTHADCKVFSALT